jgi:hypothetical protein
MFAGGFKAAPTPTAFGLLFNTSYTRNALLCLNISTTALQTSNYTRNTSPVAFGSTTQQSLPSVISTSVHSKNESSTNRVRPRAAGWSRVGYYTSSSPAQATGLSFLANHGDPQKSGTFD